MCDTTRYYGIAQALQRDLPPSGLINTILEIQRDIGITFGVLLIELRCATSYSAIHRQAGNGLGKRIGRSALMRTTKGI